MKAFKPYKRAFYDIGPIIFRNVFVLTTVIIFFVVALLLALGDRDAAIFLGIITVINIMTGIIQDTRSLIVLEKLQILTALRVVRLNEDGSETHILAEEIVKGDRIRLKLGDQVPCDGVLISSENLEASKALITGESDSFPAEAGAKLLGGEIVTSGSAVLEAEDKWSESRISKITKDLKRYITHPSPIQKATNKVMKYSGYALLAVILFVIGRGMIVHDSYLKIVMNVGALSSVIVPQGLVLITTLLFGFGASSYLSKHVLFQEINATEKLGRIKNLCMDKTGTLTGGTLVVEEMHMPEGMDMGIAAELTGAYIRGSGDSSQTIASVRNYLGLAGSEMGIIGALPFSSRRQYGAVSMEKGGERKIVVVGPPDILSAYLKDAEELKWLESVIRKYEHSGKRILFIAETEGIALPKELSQTKLKAVALFAFHSVFREGISETIKFFQDRGIKIRIISGDNPDTVSSVALSAGVKNADKVITGAEMESWKEEEFDERVREYFIFARILPEQKVKIVQALKKDGFTAMVGDGVNDALAIKNADLGIAMFDGAPATRRLASVVLTNNSFGDLPGGVELADNFIRNIETFAGMFISQSLAGLLFFLIIAFFGFTFPLTPLNITPINYFTIGIPGFLIAYWAIRPRGKILPASTEPFLSRVMPFAAMCALVQALGVALVFALSPAYLKASLSNSMVMLGFALSGFLFFTLAPRVYRGVLTKIEKKEVFLIGMIEVLVFFSILSIPLLVRFFNITTPFPPLAIVGESIGIVLAFGFFQYLLMKYFVSKKKVSEV